MLPPHYIWHSATVFNVTGSYAAGSANAATPRTLCDTGGIQLSEGVAAEESVNGPKPGVRS